MIDIHAHLCFPEFGKDIDKVIEYCKKEMTAVIASSARYKEGLGVLELSKKYPDFIYPSLGYHPTEGTNHQGVIELIKKNRDNIVSVGEVGLDYHWEKNQKKRDKQKEIFTTFIELAKDMKKPLVIHSWDAEQHCFEMVRESGLTCVFHCFSGSPGLARLIIDEGFYISVSTQVLFSKLIKRIAKAVPMDKLLLETDSPFLSPFKQNKKLADTSGFDPQRNHPWNIKLSAQKIAEIRNLPTEEVLSETERNAKRVFGI
ncbi:MAG: TatD family hydrolase [Candidatus Thorarchaeota archaeon]|jgi:TatD DNase family protein